MHRVDGPGTIASLPTPRPVGTPGYFTQGDPTVGMQATIVTDDWANAVQEEISYVVTHAGLTLNKNDRTQLDQAIRAINAAGVLGFTPVQQGGGAGQGTNKVYIGWDGTSRLKAQVDSNDLGGLALLSSNNQHFTTTQTFDLDVAITRDITTARNVTTTGTLTTGNAITANAGAITAANGRLRASTGAYNSGDNNAACLLADFAHSARTQPGYERLPSGLYIQWGRFVSVTGNGDVFNFPYAFPNSGLMITGSDDGSGMAASSFSFVGSGATQVRVWAGFAGPPATYASGIGVLWTAIGW